MGTPNQWVKQAKIKIPDISTAGISDTFGVYIRSSTDEMTEERHNPRWPFVEMLLLVFFPVPFTDSVPLIGALQPVYGRLPELVQLGIIFVAAPFVMLSSARLAVLAVRARRKTQTALCALCGVLGLLATGYATLAVSALGAGERAFAFAAAGLAVSSLLVFAEDIWRMSNKKNPAYGQSRR